MLVSWCQLIDDIVVFMTIVTTLYTVQHSILFGLLFPKNEGTVTLQNVRNLSPNTVPPLGRCKSLQKNSKACMKRVFNDPGTAVCCYPQFVMMLELLFVVTHNQTVKLKA
jgi:hypothetical protein